jgi:hypothetical protein
MFQNRTCQHGISPARPKRPRRPPVMSVKIGNIAVSVVAVMKDAGNVHGSGGSFRLLLQFLFGLLPLFFGVLLLTLFFVLLALISHDLPPFAVYEQQPYGNQSCPCDFRVTDHAVVQAISPGIPGKGLGHYRYTTTSTACSLWSSTRGTDAPCCSIPSTVTLVPPRCPCTTFIW